MGSEPAMDLALEGLVHDLNNVFETISDAAELLESDPKWADIAASIHRSVSRGRSIVGCYSASAREEQDFETVVRNAIEFGEDVLKAVNAPPVRFAYRIDPGLRVSGDSAAWERVLLNLFLNAAQATKSGGVVEVTASRGERGAEICVADNGPGIPPEILSQIFDPHFSTKRSSAGLGLHIVKTLVQQQGGTVSAANRGDTPGARFCISVPEV